MRRFFRDNGLSMFFGALFLVTIVGQSFVGQRAVNGERAEHGERALSWGGYVVSPEFAGAVLENWQSEFLQFSLFIAATVWLVQRGSNESKRPEGAGLESDAEQRVGEHAPADGPRWAKLGGLRRRLYENSLLLVMGAIFFASWGGQSLGNWRTYNEDRAAHELPEVDREDGHRPDGEKLGLPVLEGLLPEVGEPHVRGPADRLEVVGGAVLVEGAPVAE